MRTGAAISVAAHLVALTACLVLAGVRPFEPTTAEAITVDIITPDEAPPLPKEPEPELPTVSDKDSSQTSEPQQTPAEQTPQKATPPPEQKTQQAALSQKPSEPPKPAQPPKPAEQSKPVEQQQAQQPQPPQQPQEQQQSVPTASPDITSRYGMMFTLPDAGAAGDFDAKATAKANIRAEDAAALRARLKECSVLPKSVAPSDNVRIVLRIALTPDGRLAQEPLLIEASASAKGPLLMRGAMDALEKCQPYTMLPADRYNEWRMLDLSFVPKDFRGG